MVCNRRPLRRLENSRWRWSKFIVQRISSEPTVDLPEFDRKMFHVAKRGATAPEIVERNAETSEGILLTNFAASPM
jgi:hypothetical protein